MIKNMIICIILPFIGTAVGALSVVLAGNLFSQRVSNALNCFSAGVMVAASVWSLLIPAVEYSSDYLKLSFMPAAVGFWVGVLALIFIDRLVVRMSSKRGLVPQGKHKSAFVLAAAVALHNFPEGMAVGVACAGLLSGDGNVTVASVFALSLGVAIQNIPEGAVVSLPLRATGMSKAKSLVCGVLSGAVEPIGALITVLLSFLLLPLLPYFLGFAAGAMISVVVSELIPNSIGDADNAENTVLFALGFSVMMILDVAFG
ncbi:MAG: ZIP family metal transporter [Clostridia bacterium]|nr:ZIP family metal transporter [Clostridia bacterium]